MSIMLVLALKICIVFIESSLKIDWENIFLLLHNCFLDLS